MTSQLPPKRRDTKDRADLLRHLRTNARQVGVGFMDGRFPPLRPLGSSALLGDVEDDDASGVDTTQIAFWNSDSVVATDDDAPVDLALTYEPIDDHSIIVAKNGLSLLPSEWTRSGNHVTVTPSADLTIRADDVIHSPLYAYYPSDNAPAADITFLGYADGGTVAWVIPEEAVEDCLLVAVAMTAAATVVTPNGWTFLGESNAVTHAAYSGTYTYKLVLLSRKWDGTSAVPLLSTGSQAVFLMAAFDGGALVDATFTTVANATSASTPGINPSSLRVWGTIGSLVTITPSRGTPVGNAGGDDIDIAMTLDPATTAVPATVGSSSGWCLASLVVR